MTWYELNDTVTLSLEADSGSDVDLFVTAPDGTESTPATSFSTPNWSASVTADQYDQWLYTWVVDGVAVESRSFNVGKWYATLAALKKALNRTGSDATADDLLGPALEAASRSVEQYCDSRPIGAFLLDSTATQRLFRFDRWTIFDRDWCVYRVPVDDIGSLTDLAVETSSDGTTWTETTEYETWPLNALTKSQAITALVFTTCGGRLRVTAKWGWPAIPSAVRQATLLQASRLYRRKDSPEGVAAAGDWGMVRVPNLDPDVKALLAFLHTEALIA